MTKNTSRGEMVTPSYTGNILGDPRGGRTRLLTNNICSGTNYYLGVQADGSRFLDSKGSWRFDGEGEQGANNASSALVYTKNDRFTKQDRRGTNIGRTNSKGDYAFFAGMIDWGAVVVNSSAVAAGEKGLDVLATGTHVVPGTCHAPYSMARTFGDPSGQTVATKGRKVMVSWIGNGTCESQPASNRPRPCLRRGPWTNESQCFCLSVCAVVPSRCAIPAA
jgi:hypothetical protein